MFLLLKKTKYFRQKLKRTQHHDNWGSPREIQQGRSRKGTHPINLYPVESGEYSTGAFYFLFQLGIPPEASRTPVLPHITHPTTKSNTPTPFPTTSYILKVLVGK